MRMLALALSGCVLSPESALPASTSAFDPDDIRLQCPPEPMLSCSVEGEDRACNNGCRYLAATGQWDCSRAEFCAVSPFPGEQFRCRWWGAVLYDEGVASSYGLTESECVNSAEGGWVCGDSCRWTGTEWLCDRTQCLFDADTRRWDCPRGCLHEPDGFWACPTTCHPGMP
jgi:hypothetical protein